MDFELKKNARTLCINPEKKVHIVFNGFKRETLSDE